MLIKWQPIETAPKDETLHVRALWVYSADKNKTEPLYFDAAVGFIDNDDNFVTPSGDDPGWRADDYEYWMPLAEIPPCPGVKEN